MKRIRNKIAENSQAMIKIDTMIDSRPEFEQEPGGQAYAARRVETSSIKKMYSNEKREKGSKCILLITLAVAILALVFAIVFVVMWR